MRKLTSLILIVTTLVLTGCAGGPQVKEITPAIKTAAYVGTRAALLEHPEWRPGFVLAAQELTALADAPSIDFTLLLSIVHRLPVDELKSPEAELAITGATILLSGYVGEGIPLDKVEEYRPIVAALRDGISLGLR